MARESLEERYFDELRRSGSKGCGVYQIIVFAAVTSGIVGGGIVLYSLSLLEMMPRFECFD